MMARWIMYDKFPDYSLVINQHARLPFGNHHDHGKLPGSGDCVFCFLKKVQLEHLISSLSLLVETYITNACQSCLSTIELNSQVQWHL